MWQPPQRIAHETFPPRWPDAAEAAASRLFAPLEAGRLRLADRTWVPAMVPWRATEDGFVTPDVLAWYERFAQGSRARSSSKPPACATCRRGPLLRIGDDRFVPGLGSWSRRSGARAAAARASSSRSSTSSPSAGAPPREVPRTVSGHHRAPPADARDARGFRGRGPRRLRGLPDDRLREVLAPRESRRSTSASASASPTSIGRTSATCRARCPGIFASAARRASDAGFDGVELHYAHAYTMASFLSALNTRVDGYGGPREQRVRLPLEVFRAVRAAVPGDFVVGCRYLSDECIEGGSTRGRRGVFRRRVREAGMDFVSLSRGGKFEDAKQPKVGWAAYPYTGPSGWECMPTALADAAGPFGRNVDPAARIRRAIREAGSTRRSSSPAASTASTRPRRSSRRAPPTSSAPRASRSPIPTGS
jgi:dimethylglycine catabolism A